MREEASVQIDGGYKFKRVQVECRRCGHKWKSHGFKATCSKCYAQDKLIKYVK